MHAFMQLSKIDAAPMAQVFGACGSFAPATQNFCAHELMHAHFHSKSRFSIAPANWVFAPVSLFMPATLFLGFLGSSSHFHHFSSFLSIKFHFLMVFRL